MDKTLYTVVHKLFSSQPDIPWGILKHNKPLAEMAPEDLLYIDGYDLTWGGSHDEEGRAIASDKIVKQAVWETPHPKLLTAKLGSRPTPELTDLTLDEMQRKLSTIYKNDPSREWDYNYKIPYIEAFFVVEARRESGR